MSFKLDGGCAWMGFVLRSIYVRNERMCVKDLMRIHILIRAVVGWWMEDHDNVWDACWTKMGSWSFTSPARRSFVWKRALWWNRPFVLIDNADFVLQSCFGSSWITLRNVLEAVLGGVWRFIVSQVVPYRVSLRLLTSPVETLGGRSQAHQLRCFSFGVHHRVLDP